MKKPLLQYGSLLFLFLASTIYQARAIKHRFPEWFHQTSAVRWPFFPQAGPDGIYPVALTPEAASAGLHDHDILLTIGGKPLRGTAVFGEAMAHARPGDVLQVVVRPASAAASSTEKTAEVRLAPAGENSRDVTSILFFVFMPVFCLALGFWVAAVRPRDKRARLLLALMLSFSTFGFPGVEAWGAGLRDFGAVFRTVLNTTWPMWMLLFGIYFPEPFPAQWRRRWWEWLKWVVLVGLSLFTAINVTLTLGELENYPSIRFLERLPRWVMGAFVLISYIGGAGFFACIGTKLGTATSPDARRRLRLLYWGATVSLTPIFLLNVTALIMGKNFEAFGPHWLVILSLLMMVLFPLTLAHVIVVNKAMDVSVVIRQGLQYGLARGGIRVLQALATVAVVTIAATLAADPHRDRLQKITVILLGVVAVLRMRKLGERLRNWTDRRFFRDAYHAEQILSDLSDEVRSIVETQPLLETVSHRISESLHVPRVAVLLDGGQPYRPAFAIGFPSVPQVAFPDSAATVNYLRQQKEPARVYFNDPNSWIYRQPEVSESERAQLAALQTELLLPLSVKEKLLGIISLGQKRSEQPYTGMDLRLLKSVAAQTGLALENARLTATIAEEVGQRERMNREIEIAREVQERLFPQKLPAIAGLDYFGACRPALGVGGDYYDFLALPEGKLGIAIGDVSGKGIAAALTMASLQASLRSEAMRAPENIASLISNVNHLVYEASSANRYATFFYAQYDPLSRRLTYVNAGHNPPMLFRKTPAGWEVRRLDVGGVVVGLLEHFEFEQATAELKCGDILVAYTDGVSEAMNPTDEEWGEERMMESIQSDAGGSAAEMITHIMKVADAFAAGAKQHDDMTLVVLRIVSSSGVPN